MARSVTRSRTTALLAATALALTITSCSEDGAPPPAEDAASRGSQQPTEAATGASAGPTEDTTPTPEPATVTWTHPDVEGYSVSADPPAETVVQLENSDLACLIQLTHEVIPDADVDDSTYTDTAIQNAVDALGDSTETGREDATITTDAGAMDAREVSLTAVAGEAEMNVKMLLRASSVDQVLVGIVHICPAGGLDEAAWDSFVSGTTLHGTTATSF